MGSGDEEHSDRSERNRAEYQHRSLADAGGEGTENEAEEGGNSGGDGDEKARVRGVDAGEVQDLPVDVRGNEGRREAEDGIDGEHVLHLGVAAEEAGGDGELEAQRLAVARPVDRELVAEQETESGNDGDCCVHDEHLPPLPAEAPVGVREDSRQHLQHNLLGEVEEGKDAGKVRGGLLDLDFRRASVRLRRLAEVRALRGPQESAADAADRSPDDRGWPLVLVGLEDSDDQETRHVHAVNHEAGENTVAGTELLHDVGGAEDGG